METVHDFDFDRQLMISLREHLLDLDAVVDDCRRDIESAVERLQSAVARRDDTARQLASLIDQFNRTRRPF